LDVSEVGYGMWVRGNWSDEIIEELLPERTCAVDRGCIFFDTVYQYGEGQSRRLLDRLLKLRRDISIHFDTVVQPKNF
jgi:aryl-alcohol dehydrogenase-like predicted oxidoreductase